MKLIFSLGLISIILLFTACDMTWTKEDMNKAIAKVMKRDAKKLIADMKSSPYIADANIKHDKKSCGLVLYVKMIKFPVHLTAQDLKNMRDETKANIHMEIRKSKDPDTKELRSMIKNGCYVMYRFYLNNGKVFSTVKLTKNNI